MAGAREDREAAYLEEQRAKGAPFAFKLFNGEEFRGTISEFTPYTITIKTGENGDEVVIRKLAIAYYRQVPDSQTTNGVEQPAKRRASRKAAPEPEAQAQAAASSEERHQPIEQGLDSDRTGEPTAPEADNMDEDRGI